MAALILTLIILIATTAHFYLKLSPMQSFGFVISSIIGLTTAFSYYEVAADLLISRGYIPQLAQCLVLLLIFGVVTFAVQYLSSFIVGSNIDFGQPAKIATAIICGIITSLVISGVVIVAIGLAPLRKTFPYSRFGDTINVTNPSSALIPADGFVVGLYNVISKGALSSSNRFDVVHANFLDQIHLNRYSVAEGASTTAAKDAAFVEKFDVQKMAFTRSDEVYTAIVFNVKSKTIKQGGGKDSNKKLAFSLAQVRLLCGPSDRSELTGQNLKILYPKRHITNDKLSEEDFKHSDVVDFGSDSLTKIRGGNVARMKLLFEVPASLTPRYLQFKSNNIIELPKLVTQEEIDAAILEEENNPTSEE